MKNFEKQIPQPEENIENIEGQMEISETQEFVQEMLTEESNFTAPEIIKKENPEEESKISKGLKFKQTFGKVLLAGTLLAFSMGLGSEVKAAMNQDKEPVKIVKVEYGQEGDKTLTTIDPETGRMLLQKTESQIGNYRDTFTSEYDERGNTIESTDEYEKLDTGEVTLRQKITQEYDEKDRVTKRITKRITNNRDKMTITEGYEYKEDGAPTRYERNLLSADGKTNYNEDCTYEYGFRVAEGVVSKAIREIDYDGDENIDTRETTNYGHTGGSYGISDIGADSKILTPSAVNKITTERFKYDEKERVIDKTTYTKHPPRGALTMPADNKKHEVFVYDEKTDELIEKHIDVDGDGRPDVIEQY